MKRTLIFICIAAMLLSLSACADGTGNADSTTGALADGSDTTGVPAETAAFDNVIKESYGDHVFNIYYLSADNDYLDFFAENLTGEVRNDAVYSRNEMVSEALDITIQISWGSNDSVRDNIQKQVSAGEQTYDMFGWMRNAFALAYGGYLYDIASIERIDLTKEYWDQSWVKTMTINDALYAVIGDISVSTLLFTSSLTFNKELFDANGFTYPYDDVRNGTWTYEKLYTMVSGYGADLNSDNKRTYNQDRFGITGWLTESGYGLFYGSGFSFFSRNADGDYSVSYDAEELVSVTEKVVSLWNGDYAYFNNSSSTAEHPYPFSVFSEGRALFCDIVLSKIGTFFSEMTDDYGIIPQPKFSEEQENYYTYTGYTIPMSLIAANCDNPARTGTIMEALCAASYDTVTPQMLEIVTKTKNVRDVDSVEMISLIIRNKFFDVAHWYDIDGIGSFSRNMISGNNQNPASVLKTYKTIAQKRWDTIMKSYDKLK